MTHAPVRGAEPRDQAARARFVNERLSATYGPPPPLEPSDPLDGLIGTILSQHTSDTNSARAFAALLGRFGSLEAVRTAPVEAIEDAIRRGGLARVKAARIKEVLERVHAARGQVSLDFLRGVDLAEARAFLTGLSGVGPKTAACVLLFDLGLPAIPVDTHVHRVSRRLGLIGPKTTAEAAHALLEAIVPPDQAYPFHLNLIRHGRRICKAVRPHCSNCPLEDVCPKVGLVPGGTASSRDSTQSSQQPYKVV